MAFSKMQPAEWRELLRALAPEALLTMHLTPKVYPPASAYECNAFDMTSKRYMRPETAEGEQLTLLMPPCVGDVLYILSPKK